MSVTLEHITKAFNQTLVLDDITEEAPDGQMTALLGPSGSGKSTLLRVIAGLTAPDHGRVLINGRDVTDIAPRHRKIGFCFQDYAPFRHLRVAGNVEYGLRAQRVPRAERRERVDELLRLVHLDELADRYPHQLSGGQRQRMALARALAVKPDVLLLDEPFAALDAMVRSEVRTFVRELQRELGITTILVTHDQAEAMEVADRVVILSAGRIEQTGAPDEVYADPHTHFVQSFLGLVTTLDGLAVRPHDVAISNDVTQGTPGRIVRLDRLGFEVRAHVDVQQGELVLVQTTRAEADRLELHEGHVVSLHRRDVLADDGERALDLL